MIFTLQTLRESIRIIQTIAPETFAGLGQPQKKGIPVIIYEYIYPQHLPATA